MNPYSGKKLFMWLLHTKLHGLVVISEVYTERSGKQCHKGRPLFA